MCRFLKNCDKHKKINEENERTSGRCLWNGLFLSRQLKRDGATVVAIGKSDDIGRYSNAISLFYEAESKPDVAKAVDCITTRFEGPYTPINGNSPVIVDWDNARPAGYIERIGGKVYRSSQVCTRSYGEYMKIFEVEAIDESGVNQKFVKEIHPKRSKYSESFHTLNGYGNITVVDGVNKSFRPFFKLWTGLEYKLKYKRKKEQNGKKAE